MAGIIMGAIGGLGDAMQNVGSTMLKNELDTESKLKVNQQDSDLALQRAKALEEYKVQAASALREQRATRIGAAQQGIVDAKMDAKYAGSDAAVAAADAGQTDAPLTDEQRGIINSAKDTDRRRLMADRSTYVDAAIQTGDIEPKDVLASNTKSEVADITAQSRQAVQDAKNEVAMARVDAMNAKTQAQYEAAMARVEAAVAKAGNGNTDFDKKIKLLKDAGASPKEIANFITERKQPSLEDLATGFLRADPNAGTKKEMTPEQALAKAKKLRSLTQDLGDDDSSDPGTPKPAPTVKPLSTLPPGARQIGTSGGKPVYETPDGKRFIGQ
jgi:hypothetical protein